jgi:hypothetical protein
MYGTQADIRKRGRKHILTVELANIATDGLSQTYHYQ